MSLFSNLASAKGSGMDNWLKKGRTLIRVEQVEAAEPPSAQKLTFKVRGRVLYSTNPENEVGTTGTANENFKFLDSGLARVRTFIRAMRSVKEARQVLDDECGPEQLRAAASVQQPYVGVIIAVDALQKGSDPTKSGYTLYSGSIPTSDELDQLVKMGHLKAA